MVDEAKRLISEIGQIKVQYVREVGRGRRVWPRSIKDRVLSLERLGVPAKAVAEQTGISYETITTWRYQRRKAATQGPFHEIGVRAESPLARVPAVLKSATVTVAESEIPKSIDRPLTLRTPLGFVIEGLDANGVVELMNRLCPGGRHAS